MKHTVIITKTTKHFYKVLCCFCFLLLNKSVYSQINLVPNPSFERYSICPDNLIWNGSRNSKPDIWYKPDYRDANYFNRCTNKYPKDGVPYNLGGGGLITKNPKLVMLIL